MTEDKIYKFRISYTEGIIGEVKADSEDQARERINGEFGHAPNYQLVELEEGTMDDGASMQLTLPLAIN